LATGLVATPQIPITPERRVPTGIKGLDEMIEGGFPRGSMILLAGSPGSGKTIASAQYLHYGASQLNETGVYVSFVERESTFLKNMAKFGLNFEKLTNQGKFKFMDMMTPANQEVSTETINFALREVQSMNAQRLVIDSFTALASTFKKETDARVILHLLEKLMREMDCTSMLLVEVPTGRPNLGLGFEEFVVDGLIIFEAMREQLGLRKRAIITKMRGTNHSQNYCNIVISSQGLSLLPYVT
jgi:circadian clock protein KaiC